MLFSGPPGTGKTMAAEIIAAELGLDLYKIDLSTIVSKYIGETEKNLERVFREAQLSNAILFFDEADALCLEALPVLPPRARGRHLAALRLQEADQGQQELLDREVDSGDLENADRHGGREPPEV